MSQLLGAEGCLQCVVLDGRKLGVSEAPNVAYAIQENLKADMRTYTNRDYPSQSLRTSSYKGANAKV